MVLYLTCNFGPQGRPFICAPKVPTEKSSESYGQRCKLEMLVFIYAIIAPTALHATKGGVQTDLLCPG